MPAGQDVSVISASSQLRVTQCQLCTQGKEALRNAQGDLACVGEAGVVSQHSSYSQQFAVPEVCCFTWRYCHQVMKLIHVNLSRTGICRLITTGATAWPCGGQDVLSGWKKTKIKGLITPHFSHACGVWCDTDGNWNFNTGSYTGDISQFNVCKYRINVLKSLILLLLH